MTALLVAPRPGGAQAAPDPFDTWIIYGLVDGRPMGGAVEIPLGGTGSFGLASAVGEVGSNEIFPLKSPPANLRWSIAPEGRGVTISSSGSVSVNARASTGVYTIRIRDAAGKTAIRTFDVYDPQRARLAGEWSETVQIACQDGREFAP